MIRNKNIQNKKHLKYCRVLDNFLLSFRQHKKKTKQDKKKFLIYPAK